jgi:hypothetical protein
MYSYIFAAKIEKKYQYDNLSKNIFTSSHKLFSDFIWWLQKNTYLCRE